MPRAPIKAIPSQEELKRMFDYDPEIGKLTWKIVRRNAHRIWVGKEAGTVNFRGYLVIGIDRDYYYAHRIIWKIVTGNEPEFQIDHVDTDKLNNRWFNLRQASNGQNMCNSKKSKNNNSGVKGVCYVKSHKAWKAYVSRDGHQVSLGRFKSKDEAMTVRMRAAELAYGEFARHE